jgi:hypothetical protein
MRDCPTTAERPPTNQSLLPPELHEEPLLHDEPLLQDDGVLHEAAPESELPPPSAGVPGSGASACIGSPAPDSAGASSEAGGESDPCCIPRTAMDERYSPEAGPVSEREESDPKSTEPSSPPYLRRRSNCFRRQSASHRERKFMDLQKC